MRAVRASGDGGVAVVDVEPRAPEHATDPVRVRVRSCGICASDLHLAAWNLPVTLGHEFAGVLDDGTAVAVQPNAWCGACDRCLAGETQLCRSRRQPSARRLGRRRPGRRGDRRPPAASCRSAAGVDPDDRRAGGAAGGRRRTPPARARGRTRRPRAGDRRRVDRARDRGRARRPRAWTSTSWRATPTSAPAVSSSARARQLADEYGAVVDAAGTQSSLDDAVARVRPGGAVVVVATYWDPVSHRRGAAHQGGRGSCRRPCTATSTALRSSRPRPRCWRRAPRWSTRWCTTGSASTTRPRRSASRATAPPARSRCVLEP